MLIFKLLLFDNFNATETKLYLAKEFQPNFFDQRSDISREQITRKSGATGLRKQTLEGGKKTIEWISQTTSTSNESNLKYLQSKVRMIRNHNSKSKRFTIKHWEKIEDQRKMHVYKTSLPQKYDIRDRSKERKTTYETSFKEWQNLQTKLGDSEMKIFENTFDHKVPKTMEIGSTLLDKLKATLPLEKKNSNEVCNPDNVLNDFSTLKINENKVPKTLWTLQNAKNTVEYHLSGEYYGDSARSCLQFCCNKTRGQGYMALKIDLTPILTQKNFIPIRLKKFKTSLKDTLVEYLHRLRYSRKFFQNCSNVIIKELEGEKTINIIMAALMLKWVTKNFKITEKNGLHGSRTINMFVRNKCISDTDFYSSLRKSLKWWKDQNFVFDNKYNLIFQMFDKVLRGFIAINPKKSPSLLSLGSNFSNEIFEGFMYFLEQDNLDDLKSIRVYF
ncbi:hypothetical protein TUBRATIS_12840 [Tubulinosema ratisbonensis]|uniref:Uncharacterized protein n=1 Tax=Tubulinosema ratisbonensis TaxID=291195 RepID=A0A437AMH0_9MICR|nr:hypothetical protein TUBRATIS_12840 [Tubulinosema ratisbonensis]